MTHSAYSADARRLPAVRFSLVGIRLERIRGGYRCARAEDVRIESPEGGRMLLGRENHLRVLEAAIARARSGRASVSVLHGNPGVGKSALLAAAVDPLSNSREDSRANVLEDALLLRASGHATESELPYAGLQQLLAPFGSAFDGLPQPQRAALSQALALDAGAPGDRMAAASAVLRLITSAAETRTVIVSVDDFQWLDPSTRQLLIFIARRIEADAVAMLIAQRGRLSEELTGIGEPLAVEPLLPADARELLRREYPDMSSMVAGKVIERAAGLPLALIEIPAELSEAQRQARAPLPSKFPVGEFIERLYEARLEKFDDESRLALLIASLEDLAAEDLVNALAQAGLGLSALAAAERSHLVRILDGRCVFLHPTVRGAVQMAATSVEMVRAHEALAACFDSDPARYARYAQGCESVGDEEVFRALETAARQAQNQGAFAEAASAWEAAANRTRVEATERASRALAIQCYLRSGSGLQALPLLTTMIDTAADELDRARWLCTWVVTMMWVEGRPPSESDALAEFGTQLLAGDTEHVDRGLELMMALASCQFIWGAYGAGKAIVDQVRRFVPFENLPIGHRLTAENLDVMVGEVGAGDFLRTDWIDDILPEQMADPSVPVGFSGVALGWLDELEACERVAIRCKEMTDAHSGLAATKLAIGSMSVIGIERAGEWDRAALEYAGAERVSIDGDFAAPYPYIALRRAYLLAMQGRAEECDELRLRAVAGLRNSSPAIDYLDGCVGGMLALARVDHARAVEILDRCATIERRMGTIMSGLTSRFVDQFEACWRLGRAAELGAELTEFSLLGHRMGHPTMISTAARCAALLVADEDVNESFENVVRLEADRINVFESARTQLLWGVRLRRARHKGDARRHLLAAERAFEKLGAVAWLSSTRSELAACGERRAAGMTGVAGPLSSLTPREFEVAKAVAGGISNNEAAERLFISQRTVEYHLSSVFRKLDVSDRRSLAPFFPPHA